MRKVITNNVPRDVIDGSELSSRERKQFDYLDWEKIDDGRDSASFFRYKGSLYDLSNFERTSDEGWDGVCADSAFSGIAVRFVNDNEQVIVALMLA